MEQTQPPHLGTSNLHSLGRRSSERADKKNVLHMDIHQVEEFSEDKQSYPYASHPQLVASKDTKSAW